jgi:hypothetical protein
MANMQQATTELHRLFDTLNRDKFDGRLPEPAITIQNRGKHMAYGWCSQQEIWRDKADQEKKIELNICAEYLNRDADIDRMSNDEIFKACLEWEGIFGYDSKIKDWIETIYQVELKDWKGRE